MRCHFSTNQNCYRTLFSLSLMLPEYSNTRMHLVTADQPLIETLTWLNGSECSENQNSCCLALTTCNSFSAEVSSVFNSCSRNINSGHMCILYIMNGCISTTLMKIQIRNPVVMGFVGLSNHLYIWKYKKELDSSNDCA